MITPSMYDAINILRDPFDMGPPDWIKRRKEADRIMAISTAGSSPTRDWITNEIKDTLDAVDVFKAAALDTSKVLKKNGFVTINIDGDEEIHDACENAHKQSDKLRKDYKEMPTKNHEYYMKLLEEAGLKYVQCEVSFTPYEGSRIRIDGVLPTVELNTNKKEYNNMYKNNNRFAPNPAPQCKGIIRRNSTTRVDWADGTRTVIVLEEGREDMDMFHTFCIAFTKKMLGSTTAILNTIKECDTDAVEKARKEAIEKANREAEEETKKLKEEIEKAAFKKAVQERMFEERVIEEAIRRISIQEERRMNREDPVESFQVIDVRAVEVEEEKTDETRE